MIIKELVKLKGINKVTSNCYSMAQDGVMEYIDCTNNATLDMERTDSFTISAWVKLNSYGVTVTSPIVTKWDLVLVKGYQLRLSATGQIEFLLRQQGGATQIFIRTTTIVPLNQWVNITLSYDGTSFAAGSTIYLNGVSQAFSIIGNSLAFTTLNNANLYIGHLFTNYMDGLFYNVKMWNIELTALEVGDEYTAKSNYSNVQSGNLILSTDIQGSSWNGSEYNIPDLTGVTTGYVTVNAEIEDKVKDCPPPCYSMALDGAIQYIEAPINAAYDLDRGDVMSFGCWVKFDTLDVFNQFFTKYVGSKGILFMVTLGELRLDLQNSGGLNGLIVQSTGAAIIAGVWYHLAATYDGSSTPAGIKLYKNGVLLTNGAPISNTLSLPITNAATVQLGRVGSFYVDMKINTARWWNAELTAGEVLTEYNSGSVLTTPVQAASLIFNTDINNSTWNGAEYDIPDLTGITAGYQTVNAEVEDLVEDCP